VAASSGGCRRILERRQQLGAHHLSHRDRAAHVADWVLDNVVRGFLAVVDLLAVEVDLEATLSNGRQRDADFPITPGTDLGCQTGSLPEVPSRNAVLDLQLDFAFSHVR
jgi:hypothetical protein